MPWESGQIDIETGSGNVYADPGNAGADGMLGMAQPKLSKGLDATCGKTG